MAARADARLVVVAEHDGWILRLLQDGLREHGVVVIATDISDLIATQELLEEAEGRYRTLVEQLPAVSYIAEPGAKGTWQYVSPQPALIRWPPSPAAP